MAIDIIVNGKGGGAKGGTTKASSVKIKKGATAPRTAKQKPARILISKPTKIIKKTTVVKSVAPPRRSGKKSRSRRSAPKKGRSLVDTIVNEEGEIEAKVPSDPRKSLPKYATLREFFWRYPYQILAVALIFAGTVSGIIYWYIYVYNKKKDEQEKQEKPPQGGVGDTGDATGTGDQQRIDPVIFGVLVAIILVSIIAVFVLRVYKNRANREITKDSKDLLDVEVKLNQAAVKSGREKGAGAANARTALSILAAVKANAAVTMQQKKMVIQAMDEFAKENSKGLRTQFTTSELLTRLATNGFPQDIVDVNQTNESRNLREGLGFVDNAIRGKSNIYNASEGELQEAIGKAVSQMQQKGYEINDPNALGQSLLESIQNKRDLGAEVAIAKENAPRMFELSKIKPNVGFNDLVGINGSVIKKFSDPNFAASNQSYNLLYGPPGTGKSAIAEAVANNGAQVLAYGSDKQTSLKGRNAKDIRALFLRAFQDNQEGKRTVLFFDEVDKLIGTDQEIQQAFLENMQQFQGKVSVIMTTNNYGAYNDGTGSAGILPAIENRIPANNRILLKELSAKDKSKLLNVKLTQAINRDENIWSEDIRKNLKAVTDRIARATNASGRAITLAMKDVEVLAQEVRNREGRVYQIDEKFLTDQIRKGGAKSQGVLKKLKDRVSIPFGMTYEEGTLGAYQEKLDREK